MKVSDPIPRGANNGPDGSHYPFGWLGLPIAQIGKATEGYTILPVREDRDDEDPHHFVIYGPADGGPRRNSHTFETLPMALMAVSLLMRGIDINAIAQIVPFIEAAAVARGAQ